MAQELILGRSTGLDHPLQDSSISRLHARIYRKKFGYFIEDLGSRNGTYANGEAVKTAQHAKRRRYAFSWGRVARLLRVAFHDALEGKHSQWSSNV